MSKNPRNDERKKSVSSQYPSPVKDSCESETQGFSSSRQKICPVKGPVFVIVRRVPKSGCTASDYVYVRDENGKILKLTTLTSTKKKAKEVCGSIYKVEGYGGILRQENRIYMGCYNRYRVWLP